MTIWNNRAKWRLICSVSDELVFAFSSPPKKLQPRVGLLTIKTQIGDAAKMNFATSPRSAETAK